MRIPLSKIYRAFPELDQFSDAQCRLLMRRVRLDGTAGFLVRVVPVAAFALSLAGVLIFLAASDVLERAEAFFEDADILVGLLSASGIPAAVALLVRDRLLRRFLLKAIRLRIDRVRCRKCRYILIGQRPNGDAVTCPECGGLNSLRALGIAADDLIPPESELSWLSSEAPAGQAGASAHGNGQAARRAHTMAVSGPVSSSARREGPSVRSHDCGQLMTDRQRVSTGSPYEPKIGLSRAVRAGQIIAVTGTAPLDAVGNTIGVGDPAAQARRCLEIIAEALKELGADLEDVVRTRIFLTRIEDWEAVGGVHGEYFGAIRPANTVVQVARFIDPDWLVEIEADAVVDEGAA